MQLKSKLCKSGAGAAGRSLPDDIIYELLLRQPALRRLRTVCKGWRALISDPSFLAEWRSRAGAGPLIVAMFGSGQDFELRLMDMDGNVVKVFDVTGTTGCKGAFLAPTRLDLIFVDRKDLGAMVIDPAFRRDFTIVGTGDPQPQPPPNWYWVWEPPSSTAVDDYSFGRAVPSGDYKVLRLHLMERDGQRHSQWCEVGTIMEDGAEPTWRRKPWGPFFQNCFSCEKKATVNGDLYFLLCGTSSVSHGRDVIATFNLESEEWKKIRGPMLGHKNVEDKWSTALTEFKGTLCMIHDVQNLTDFGSHYANLWLLKDPSNSVWAKEYKIQLPQMLVSTKPLDVLLDGRLLLLNKFWKDGNKKCHRYILQFYNSSAKSFTDFMKMAEGFNGRMAFYTGSLQSQHISADI